MILVCPCRARKGVGGAVGNTTDCLRDVPVPRETESDLEGPAAWTFQKAFEHW